MISPKEVLDLAWRYARHSQSIDQSERDSGKTSMHWRICLITLSATLVAQPTHADGFKCSLDHVTRVGVNSSYEDEVRGNKDVDFFLAINDTTGTGTSSACTPSGCSNTDIQVLKRRDDDRIRSIVLVSAANAELWTLESFGDPNNYRVVTVSINGGLSQSQFGQCKRMVQISGH